MPRGRRDAPPRLAELLLALCLPRGPIRQTILGDLREEYRWRCASEPEWRVRAWYSRQLIEVGGHYLAARPFRRRINRKLRKLHDGTMIDTGGGGQLMSLFVQDAKQAARGFMRSPGFSAITVLTLALGIGVNSAIFSMVNGVLLEPLPYPEADRIASISTEIPGYGVDRTASGSDALFLHYSRTSRSFESLAAWDGLDANLTGGDRPDLVPGARITSNLFSVFGIAPAIGRGFLESEMAPGAPDVAMISHRLWQDRFRGDPGVLGTSIEIDETPTVIVGVLSAEAEFAGGQRDVILPFRIDEERLRGTSFGPRIIGRLAVGVDAEAATAELATVMPSLPETDPNGFFTEATIREGRLAAIVNPLMDDIVGSIRTTLWILLGSVGFVLLIACGMWPISSSCGRRDASARSSYAPHWEPVRVLWREDSSLRAP